TPISSTRIDLDWVASVDDRGVAGYRVFRNGVEIATALSSQFSDTGLSPSTSYAYQVSAFDAAGNESARSAVENATTLTPDTTPPSTPTGLVANVVSHFRVDLSWNPSSDNRGVVGYDVLRNGVLVGSAQTTAFSDSALMPSTSYTWRVIARDAEGNASSPSAPVQATTLDPPPFDSFLVAGWALDELDGDTAFDSSGGMHDGALAGNASRTVGRYGRAVEVNGVSARVELGAIDFPGEELSIAAWIRADDFGIPDGRVISKATGIAEQNHWWMLSTFVTGGVVQPRFRLKTSSGGTSTLIANGPGLTAGIWTHLVAT